MNELQLQVTRLVDKFLPAYYKSVDVDTGWYQIVVDCDKELTGVDPKYQIAQIKQKFGGLRYYTHPSNRDDKHTLIRIGDIISKYEDIAAVTCEATGKTGVLMKSKNGWLKTLNPEWAKASLFYKDYTIVNRSLYNDR